MSITMEVIGHVRSDFPQKFGIPRQAGLVPELKARVVFAPAYRNPEALRGLEGFSHIWLLWNFSGNPQGTWSPTVRPGWAATGAWGSLPPGPLSVPTPSACPVFGWRPSTWRDPRAPRF